MTDVVVTKLFGRFCASCLYNLQLLQGHIVSPWQMLLPLCYHCWLMLLPYVFLLADVIAICFVLAGVIAKVADVIATVQFGWCYCLGGWMLNPPMSVGDYSQLADGIANGQFLSFNSDVLCKTSSHM